MSPKHASMYIKVAYEQVKTVKKINGKNLAATPSFDFYCFCVLERRSRFVLIGKTKG